MDDPIMRQKTALIIGITGQDGSYLAEFLLQKGYRVIGILPKSICDDTAQHPASTKPY